LYTNPIYKITTKDLWEQNGNTLKLSPMDENFIHFAEADDVDRIVCKFFPNEQNVVVLKIDPTKLTGKLVKELNPGGSREFYHLYGGTIPKAAVISFEML